MQDQTVPQTRVIKARYLTADHLLVLDADRPVERDGDTVNVQLAGGGAVIEYYVEEGVTVVDVTPSARLIAEAAIPVSPVIAAEQVRAAVVSMTTRYGIACQDYAFAAAGRTHADERARLLRRMHRRFVAVQRLTRALANVASTR